MNRKLYLILSIFLILFTKPGFSAEKYCFSESRKNTVKMLVSVNVDSQKNVMQLNSYLLEKSRILVHPINSNSQVNWVYQILKPGDCIVFNTDEIRDEEVDTKSGWFGFLKSGRKKLWFPVSYLRRSINLSTLDI